MAIATRTIRFIITRLLPYLSHCDDSYPYHHSVSFSCHGARLICVMRRSRRFRNLGQRLPVVVQAILLKLIILFVSPLLLVLSSAAPFGKLIPHPTPVILHSQSSFHFRFHFYLRLLSSTHHEPMLHFLPSCNGFTSTIHARNQPSHKMAGVRLLSCTRCRTKCRRRLRDLPMSRNNTSLSSLTLGRGQY